MTRENLIFLGACTLLSTKMNRYDAEVIADATRLYDRIHGKPEEWEVQVCVHGKWWRSGNDGIKGTFFSKKEAEDAMEYHRSSSTGYRVRKLENQI